MLNEYLRLLARRESKEVLGKKSANLWLLTAVLAATFISIAFSNGSMIYLDEKMNDPFTNWVDIKNNKTGGTARLVRDLDDEALRERFLYDNVQQDHINSLIFQGRTGQDCYLEIRFFEHLQGKIVEAVMNPDNLVGGARVPSEGLNDETVGVILSESALTRLGFSEDSIPAYVDHKSYAVGPNVDPAFVPGFRDGFAPVALPVLGVVRRLPGNVDMIASTCPTQWPTPTSPPPSLPPCPTLLPVLTAYSTIRRPSSPHGCPDASRVCSSTSAPSTFRPTMPLPRPSPNTMPTPT